MAKIQQTHLFLSLGLNAVLIFILISLLFFSNVSQDENLTHGNAKSSDSLVNSQRNSETVPPQKDEIVVDKNKDLEKKVEIKGKEDSEAIKANKRFVNKFRGSTNLSKDILASIDNNEFTINEQLKSSYPQYTPLLASLVLDRNLQYSNVVDYISRGATVYTDSTWLIAASIQSPEIVKLLIDDGLNAQKTVRGKNLVTLAFLRGNLETVRALEGSGYRLQQTYFAETKNADGDTVLIERHLVKDLENGNNRHKEKLMEYLLSRNGN